MLTYHREGGATDVSVVIRIVDSGDGTPETGVVFNTSGIDLQYRREGATSTAITEASLSALTDAHSDGGVLHIGNGYYRLDLPDAAVAAGVSGVLIHGTVTGMVVIGAYIHLQAVPARVTEIANNTITAAAAATDFGAEIADAVLDEALSGHTTVGSLGQRLQVLHAGTAQAGAAGSITLASGASSTDDFYPAGSMVILASGTGAGQARTSSDYVGSTRVLSVDSNWVTNPDNTTGYIVVPGASSSLLSSEVATAVWSATTRTLSNGAGVKKNTAQANFMFKMVDATDGFTAETGVTVTATRSLDGAAFGACANGVTEVASGWYRIDLAAADLNGDIVVLRFTGAGCRDTEIQFVTEP